LQVEESVDTKWGSIRRA